MNDLETNYYKISQEYLFEGQDNLLRIDGYGEGAGNPIQVILEKLKSSRYTLGNICDIHMGLVSRADKVSLQHLRKHPNLKTKKGDGIFVLSSKELKVLNLPNEVFEKYVRPFYKNSDIDQNSSNIRNKYWLLYIKDEGEPIVLSNLLKNYFEKYKTLLIKQKENFLKNEIAAVFVKRWLKNGNYFVLFNPKEEKYFTGEKIVAPYRSKSNRFAYNERPWFASQDVCFILPKKNEFHPKFILALLNSKLYFAWLLYKGNRKGNILELAKGTVSEIQIKAISKEDQQSFISLADQIIEAKQSRDLINTHKLEKEVDQLVYQLYGLTKEEIAIVEESVGR